jgi:hypothetical protein
MNAVRLEFDHVGIPCSDVQSDETFVEATRVWVTNPRQHPQCLEFLRYADDSPVKGPLRERPHVAERLGLPVAIEHDVRAAAMAEIDSGSARGVCVICCSSRSEPASRERS